MKRIALMPGQERPWLNYELSKDCGLVPYLLMKNHKCDAFVVSGEGEEYPYLKIMDGFRVEKIKDSTLETKLEYIRENARNLDAVIFYGITWHNIWMAEELKSVNEKCLLACALDMNPDFIDRLPFYQKPYCDYLASLDLMWQSDTEMTEFLNEKWYWEVVCERNGFYNLERGTSDVEYYPFEKRENVIVYVGRINDEHKHVSMLMKAFANVADRIPDWKLRLVGPVEDPFGEYIETFFDYYPELAERVEFTGNITGREQLHHEYEKAKIFASATWFEGGTPNAMAEAVCSGCVMAITKIGAYKDVIGDNESGLCVDVSDEEGFGEMLVELIQKSDLEKMSKVSHERGNKLYNMENIVRDIYGRLCAKGL